VTLFGWEGDSRPGGKIAAYRAVKNMIVMVSILNVWVRIEFWRARALGRDL